MYRTAVWGKAVSRSTGHIWGGGGGGWRRIHIRHSLLPTTQQCWTRSSVVWLTEGFLFRSAATESAVRSDAEAAWDWSPTCFLSWESWMLTLCRVNAEVLYLVVEKSALCKTTIVMELELQTWDLMWEDRGIPHCKCRLYNLHSECINLS